jgi:hypothetical protein
MSKILDNFLKKIEICLNHNIHYQIIRYNQGQCFMIV